MSCLRVSASFIASLCASIIGRGMSSLGWRSKEGRVGRFLLNPEGGGGGKVVEYPGLVRIRGRPPPP